MKTRRGRPVSWLAFALCASLLAGIVVSWSPRYWPVTVAMASLTLVGLAWAFTARTVDLPPQSIPVALIGGWGFLQLAIHKTSIPAFTLRTSVVWLMCAVSFVLASQILRYSRERSAFLRMMLWAVTFLAVESLLQAYSSPVRVFGIFPAEDSVFGTMFYTNHFAALMDLIAPVALWLVLRGKVVAGGLGYAAMFAGTVVSGSRTGVILLLVELLVFLIVMVIGRKMPLKSAVATLAVLAVLMIGASVVAGPEKAWNRFQERNPYGVRLSLLKSTLNMTRESPWFGFGIGTWRSAYPRFATLDTASLANEAHNDWAQWAAEGGVPFFLFFVVLVGWLARPALRSVWGLGFLAFALHSVVDYPMREPSLQFLWFGMAGALAQVGRKPSESDPEV
jgi:O-antigen ligase